MVEIEVDEREFDRTSLTLCRPREPRMMLTLASPRRRQLRDVGGIIGPLLIRRRYTEQLPSDGGTRPRRSMARLCEGDLPRSVPWSRRETPPRCPLAYRREIPSPDESTWPSTNRQTPTIRASQPSPIFALRSTSLRAVHHYNLPDPNPQGDYDLRLFIIPGSDSSPIDV